MLQNLLFRFTVWITVNGTLKPPKNITQLNTKFGFSVTMAHWKNMAPYVTLKADL